MKLTELIAMATNSFNKPIKIYYKSMGRTPQIGMFVKHSDHDEIIRREFIRFVPMSDWDNYKVAPKYFTKMIDLNVLNYLILVDEKHLA